MLECKFLRSGDTVVFKDLSRFTREAENGYIKYMEWFKRYKHRFSLENTSEMIENHKYLMDCVNEPEAHCFGFPVHSVAG